MAFDLDGTNHALTAPSSVVNLNEGTFTGWFAPDFAASGGANRYFFDTDTARHAFYYNAAQSGIEMYNDGRVRQFSAAWTTGVFSHFAFVYSKGSDLQQVYINGTARTLIGGPFDSWGASGLGTNVHVAQRFATEERFDGDIAEVATWSVMLSAAEIASLAKGFSPALIRPASLNAYWPLIRDGRPRFKGAVATLIGTPAVSAQPRVFYPVYVAELQLTGGAEPEIYPLPKNKIHTLARL